MQLIQAVLAQKKVCAEGPLRGSVRGRRQTRRAVQRAAAPALYVHVLAFGNARNPLIA